MAHAERQVASMFPYSNGDILLSIRAHRPQYNLGKGWASFCAAVLHSQRPERVPRHCSGIMQD